MFPVRRPHSDHRSALFLKNTFANYTQLQEQSLHFFRRGKCVMSLPVSGITARTCAGTEILLSPVHRAAAGFPLQAPGSNRRTVEDSRSGLTSCSAVSSVTADQ